MPARNVNWTDCCDRFVEKLVTSGRFSDASEVMRAGLRLLEQRAREDAEKLAALRSLASEGFSELDQGQGTPVESRAELTEFVGQIGRRAAEEVEHRIARG